MPKLITALAVTALTGLAAAPCALAQILPSGGVSSYDIGQSSVSVGVDPQTGVAAEVDAGGGTGLSVEAGPEGTKLDLRQGVVPTALPASTPSQPSGREPASAAQPAGGGDAPAAVPAGLGGRAQATSAARARAAEQRSATGAVAGERDPGAGSADRRAATNPVADRTKERGVAPFLDFIEEIPRAVWAGLFALALIAIAMWTMWVRGRRRLERNAWVDAETGAMNVVAFETLLAQEWTRSGRYQRPLALLLLDLEEDASGDRDGRRTPGSRRMRRAWDAIGERVREADTVAQLSASRIAVICPESSHGSAETLARALESVLEAEQVHARVGVGERFESDRGPADLVSRAAADLEQSGAWAGVVTDTVARDARRALHVAA